VLPLGPSSYVPSSRRGIVSVTSCHDFGGPKREAPPLPADDDCSRFGTVSVGTDRQALAGLSWLSYSRPGFLARSPSLVIAPPRGRGPVPLVAKQKLPTPAWLNEPHGTSTRIALRLWSEPPRRDLHPLCSTRPDCVTQPGMSLSPSRCVSLDRTSGLFPSKERLYSDEPPSNRTSMSPCIRLYGSAPLRAVSSAPLDRLVGRLYREMPLVSMTA
jgi:hypothetical protein